MMSFDARIANINSDRASLEAATAYRMNDGTVLAIAQRERCPHCGGTIKITTAPDADGDTRFATFVRLHLRCVQV